MDTNGLSTAAVESKLALCENKIEDLKANILDIMNQLRVESPSLTTLVNKVIVFDGLQGNSKCVKMRFNGVVYNVVNSPNMSVLEMFYFLNANGITQGRPELDNSCLQLAEALGRRLFYKDYNLSGKARPDGKRIKTPDIYMMGANNYWHDIQIEVNGDITDPAVSEDAKNTVIDILYEELSNGRPCVLQVEHKSKDGHIHRHYVTVIGMRDGVTSKNVTESDFLIFDPAGADFQQLGTRRHIYTDKMNPNHGIVRVQTIVDKETVLANVNKARHSAGMNSEIDELEDI